MENLSQESDKKLTSLNEQLDTKNKSFETNIKENRQLTAQNQAMRNEIEILRKNNSQLQKKLKESEEMNNELLKKILENDPPKLVANKPKVMIIGDSNIQRTKQHLDRQKASWTITNNIYRISELNKETKNNPNLIETIQKQDQVIIHLGTNDLRGNQPDASQKHDRGQSFSALKFCHNRGGGVGWYKIRALLGIRYVSTPFIVWSHLYNPHHPKEI